MSLYKNTQRAYLPSIFNHGADARVRDAAGDLLAAARCPRCRHPLVVRLNGAGPYFHCGCARHGRAHALKAA